MNRYSIQLQLLVIVVAFTAILGRLIELPAPILVLWRTSLSAIIMFAWLNITKQASLTVARDQAWKGIGVGVILGLHWITFFGSIQLANISVCLAGLASISFFTSLTEPLLEKKRPRIREVLLGIMVIPGLLLIAGASWHHITGFVCALVSAFLAALFPVLNRRFALKGIAPQTLTFYEMIGAAATCLLASIIYQPQAITHLPSTDDWLWLGLLAGVCTVWAFSTHIKLLKHFNAFTTNLAFNFEPVYGILLASLIFGEHTELNSLFYLGAGFIIAANLIHSFLSKKSKRVEIGPGEIPVDR